MGKNPYQASPYKEVGMLGTEVTSGPKRGPGNGRSGISNKNLTDSSMGHRWGPSSLKQYPAKDLCRNCGKPRFIAETQRCSK